MSVNFVMSIPLCFDSRDCTWKKMLYNIISKTFSLWKSLRFSEYSITLNTALFNYDHFDSFPRCSILSIYDEIYPIQKHWWSPKLEYMPSILSYYEIKTCCIGSCSLAKLFRKSIIWLNRCREIIIKSIRKDLYKNDVKLSMV